VSEARVRPRPSDTGGAAPPRRLLLLLAAVFAVKLVVLFQLKDHPLLQADSGLDTTAYATLAGSVLSGNVLLSPGLYYVSPLYIYVLAAGLAIFKSDTAVRVCQLALGTAAVGFIFGAARVWFGNRAAWVAAVLAGLTGLFTFYEVLILQSSIDVFLTSAALYLLAMGIEAPPSRGKHVRLLAAGVVFGVQTLNRPNILFAAAVVIVVLAMGRRRIRPALWVAAGIVVGLAPIAIRNLAVTGEWTLVSSHGGLNFYIGNNPNATGFYALVPGVTPNIAGQEHDVRAVASQALGHSVTAAEASDYFFGLGRAWIVSNPGQALLLFLKKLGYVFSSAHAPLPHSYPFYARDMRTALRFLVVGPWLLIPLGLAGLVIGLRSKRSRGFTACAAFVPAYAAAVAVFFVAERYRLPMLVPLCVCSGAAVDYVVRACETRRTSTLAIPAAAAGMLFVAVNWPLHLDDGRWMEGLRLTQTLAIHHRYDEAERWSERLDAANPPRPGAAHHGLGEQLLQMDEPARALPSLQAAVQADPQNTRAEYEEGQALLRVGRTADALPHLQHGFDAGIELPGGGVDLAVAYQSAGKLSAAVDTIKRIRPDPQDPDAFLRLGRLAAEVHAPDVAAPLFEHAVTLRPDDASARLQYGLDLLVLGRDADAVRELTVAVERDPRDAQSLSHLAYAEARLQRFDAARTHAQAAVAIDAADPLARQLLAALR
jgi:4-amino-4-deoxy-L-arabinose transferase-like glycosyltransferase